MLDVDLPGQTKQNNILPRASDLGPVIISGLFEISHGAVSQCYSLAEGALLQK